MKRCPDCEFLYYDDQEHCDMDGSRLIVATTLPPATEGMAPPKSIWGALAIPLLATLVLGAVLFILYRPTRPVSSPASAPTKPASQRMPAASKDSQLPASDASQSPATNAPADSPSSDEPSTGPANSGKPKTAKPDNSAPAAKESAPVSQIQEAPSTLSKPAGSHVANETSPLNTKATTGSYPISNHPNPPGAPATATPKAANQNANKDSKVTSLIKKAGKILKKPF